MDWRDIIVSDEKVLLGKPIIMNTRISVELIFELLASNWAEKDILESYPNINREHLMAVYSYINTTISEEKIYSF